MVFSFSYLREAYLDDIMAVIRDVMTAEPEQSSLAEMGEYHMSTGGKRLRAILPLAVADALDSDPERIVPFAAACELLHNATLVHDDLQDGDRTRREREAVWSKFGAERAINLGDAMLYWPLRACDRLEVDADQKHRIIQRIVSSTLRVIDGQEREFLLQRHFLQRHDDADIKASDDVGRQAYTAMVEGKTGGLFALPIAGAAVLCESDDELASALAQAATHLGVMFQIQDDILDLYGDKGREHRGADIEEGKVSALVIYHLERTEPTDRHGREWLRELLARDREAVDRNEIETAADAFRESGALQTACEEIHRRRGLATNQPALRERTSLQRLLEAISDLMLAPIDHVLDDVPGGPHE